MSQIIILGISGLDADLLRVYGPSLPNLRRLMLASPFLELKSTIPPEPVPAWSSLYTGLNPANHGMLVGMDCLERVIPDTQLFQAEPFWERAARAGKRVCVLNPLLSGTDQVNERFFLARSQPFSPNTLPSVEDFPALLDEPLIPPASQLENFCLTLRQRTEQQVAFALERLARKPWDLFFVQLDALDYVQHFLWRYSDPGDPMYPGKNEHASRILDFYKLFDQIVGRFHAAISKEAMLAVVSSHGHGRRCIYRLQINEWLRTQNFLKLEGQSRPATGTYFTNSKEQRRGMHPGHILAWLKEHLPWSNNKARQSIDREQSVARLVELASGTSSYGGIRLNRELLQRLENNYEQVRSAILTGLEQLSFKDSPVVNWARKREECYHGQHLDLYPDIIFELRSDFGVGRSMFSPLTTSDSTHRLISGTHSPQGVFLLENWPEELEIYEDFQDPTVMDIAPTILRLLDMEDPALDGRALIYPRPVRQLI